MKYKLIRLILLILSIFLLIYFVVTHYDSKEYNQLQMKEYITKLYKVSKAPGISIAVYDTNKEYFINVGYADCKNKKLVESNTNFELGSTTKAFTGLGIMLLEQDKKINRKDLVTKYLPWFAPTYKGKKVDITIEELLCHTSGIPVWTISKFKEGTVKEQGLKETIQSIAHVKLDYEPGSKHQYATINYDVLALLIEQITGENYETYMKTNVLNPLGMTNSFYRIKDSKDYDYAKGYRYTLLGVNKYDAPTYYGNIAAGYLVSNSEDLMCWLKAQLGMNNQVNLKLMQAIKDSKDYSMNEVNHYFAGWNFHDTYICHSGNNPNFASQVYVNKEKKKAVFALTNVSSSVATKAADGVFRMIQGEKVKIGLILDANELLDFISVLLILLECFIGTFIIEKRKIVKEKMMIKCIFAVLVSGLVSSIPYMLHYSYSMLLVWYTPCAFVAVAGAMLCLDSFIITKTRTN